MDSKYDYPRYFGPNGIVPDDVWSIRRFAVVERTPKEQHHPYSSVVMLWDTEDWHPVDGADVRPPAESVQVAHLLVPLERGFRAMGRD